MDIFSFLGPFIGGLASSTIGRKWGLLSSSIPFLVGWILVVVATDVGFIYAGRVLWGVGMGMVFSISPVYCTEIATVMFSIFLSLSIHILVTKIVSSGAQR